MANTNGRQVNPVMAGLAGAALGAGVAILTSKILSDQRFRDKIMNTASGIGEKAGRLFESKIEKPMERVSHEISRGRKKMKSAGGGSRRSKKS